MYRHLPTPTGSGTMRYALTPEQSEGPYYRDLDLMRSDAAITVVIPSGGAEASPEPAS